MQNKNEGNENKKLLGDLNCTMDKIDRDGENKTQRLYRCCSSYALFKLIVDNGLDWESMEKGEPKFPWVHLLDVLYQGSRIDRVYTDIIIAYNTKINHIMVSCTIHYSAISIDRLPQKLKLKTIYETLMILFYVSLRSPQLQRLSFLY